MTWVTIAHTNDPIPISISRDSRAGLVFRCVVAGRMQSALQAAFTQPLPGFNGWVVFAGILASGVDELLF